MTQQAQSDFDTLQKKANKNKKLVVCKLSRLPRHGNVRVNTAVIASAAKYYETLKKLADE